MSEDTTPQKKTSGLAIAGLVLGIIAAVTSFVPIVNNASFFIALIGLVLAVIALVGAIKGKNSSKGMAVAGVVLCVISCVIVLVTQSIYGAALQSVSDSMHSAGSPQSTSSNASEEAPKAEEGAPADAAPAAEESAPAEETPAAEESASDQGKAEEAPAEDFMHLSVGQAVNYEDGLTVAVTEFERGLTDYSGNPVTRVSVTYVNNGDEDVSFGTYDWDGEDASGVQRGSAFISDTVNELKSGSLSPGGSISGNLYLEGDVIRVIYTQNMFLDDSKSAWVL